MPKLSEYISVNNNFKNAINIYLNLNKTDKILSYIPTKSSVAILDSYISAVLNNIEQSTILIGPYGKGKSHLLLVMLAVLTLERNEENNEIIKALIEKLQAIDSSAAKHVKKTWEKKNPFLPVIISNSYSDLDQAFLVALNDAIRKAGLTELIPETFYSRALENIESWKSDYKETYNKFLIELENKKLNIQDFDLDLKQCNKNALSVFTQIYPSLTSGSQFNPMINTDLLPLFKNISEILCDEYNYGGIYIVFDEFSKFIESKDKTAAGNDMELLQKICELAQESKNAQIYITMVAHKSIKEYGGYLSKDIINSFTGIEGRITEKLFVTSSKNNYELIQNAIIKDTENEKLYPQIREYTNKKRAEEIHSEIPIFHSTFEFNDFMNIVVRGCYPLNPVSAYMLLNISERVAQNERTLFTFISKNEPNSMGRYILQHEEEDAWIVGADLVYDYFKGIFKKNVSEKFIHDEWLKADYAISLCSTPDEVKLVKALAIINIINRPEELPADRRVLKQAVKIAAFDEVLDSMLGDEKVIYFKSSNGRIAFKTNIGEDFGKLVKNRRPLFGNRINVGKVLTSVSDYDFIIPKKYNQDFLMTRYFRFEFMEFDSFFSIMNGDSLFSSNEFCDGKVIAIINEGSKNHIEEIRGKVRDFGLKNLIVLAPSKPFAMFTQVQDFEIIQSLKQDQEFIKNYAVLQTELEVFEEDLSIELNRFLNDAYGKDSDCIAIKYDEGTENKTKEEIHFNLDKIVSNICEEVFSQTPIINNELINRQDVTSAPIKKARRSILSFVLSGMKETEFYKGSSPEATIFRSLFIKTGVLDNTCTGSTKDMLDSIYDFLEECQSQKLKISDLINKLIQPPIGMRKGLIPCYLAYCICKKPGDIVAYLGAKEFDITEDILLNMCELKNEYYLFVSIENAEKESYIGQLNALFMREGNFDLTGSRLNNILVSMQRWYRAQSQYSRSFKKKPDFMRDDKLFCAMLEIRTLLQKADANPYEIIFNDIPCILNLEKDYRRTIEELKCVKQMLETHLDLWLEGIAKETKEIFSPKAKEDLYHVLKKWYDRQSTLSKQKVMDNKVTGLMNCIGGLNVFDDNEITRKLARIITGIYVENWTDDTQETYFSVLKEVKREIEEIRDGVSESAGDNEVSFRNSKGVLVTRYFEPVTENNGTIMRNLIEEALDSYSDSVSTNEQVAILVEMLERILS